MKEFSVPMALMDFIPVILFLVSSLIIGKDLKKRMGTANNIIYCAGCIFVTASGILKAAYKLLYAVGVSDDTILWMNGQFFPNQSIGFLLAGIALLLSLKKKADPNKFYAAIPTGIFVGTSVIGFSALYAALISFAVKMKNKPAAALLAVSFLLGISMGLLSSRDFDTAKMNWIAQFINTAGQGTYLAGCLILHKNGLGNFD